MPDDRFWELIEESRHEDQDEQASRLNAALDALAADDVLAFRNTFDRQIGRSYTWDLWGAAYVIHGGCGDDGFDYFRAWLVSRGHETFEAALSDADALAGLIPEDQVDPCEFEEFMSVADTVWLRKTKSARGKGGASPVARPTSPSGTPWAEESDALAARWPRLWARFGDSPLM